MEILDFGTISTGEMTHLYTLETNKIKLCVTDYGTSLVNLFVLNNKNEFTDIVLGYDNVNGYENDAGVCIGCNVGRNANRIGNASFKLDNQIYHLDKNDNENNLHSGFHPYFKRLWKVEEYTETQITFSLESPHMDQGFPGNLKIFISYELMGDNAFKICYKGTPDEDTIINITNHSYFNLNGNAKSSVLNHRLMVNADTFTPSDENSIPTGEIARVENTPMDFCTSKVIGENMDYNFTQIKQGNGYDHNWCINHYTGNVNDAIAVVSDESGIKMHIATNYPGIQIYTANFLENVIGKNNDIYTPQSAICFEPQFYPDAINKPDFISPICKANENFYKEIHYTFFS